MPQFIITGVTKCGTSATANFLETHPDLTRAKHETNFFNIDENYKRGIEYYKSFFPKEKSGILYEKSPAYYKSWDVPVSR